MLTGLFIYFINRPASLFSLAVVSNTLRDELFRETTWGRRSSERLHEPHSSCVPADEPRRPFQVEGNYIPPPLLTNAMPVREVLSAGSKYSRLPSNRIRRVEPTEVRAATVNA